MARGTQKAPAAQWRQQALWSGFNVVPCSVSHAAPCSPSEGITSAPPWSVEICSPPSLGHYRHSPMGHWPEVLLILPCLIFKWSTLNHTVSPWCSLWATTSGMARGKEMSGCRSASEHLIGWIAMKCFLIFMVPREWIFVTLMTIG